MRQYVKNISRFLTEALNKVEWLNYKDQTTVGADSSNDVQLTSELLLNLLNVDDTAALLFTGVDVSIGDDYAYFLNILVPQAQLIKHDKVPNLSFIQYYKLYQYKEKFFVILEIRDDYEYSYVFIRVEDYEFFDKIDQPVVPELTKPVQAAKETPPVQTTAAEAAQGAAGASIV